MLTGCLLTQRYCRKKGLFDGNDYKFDGNDGTFKEGILVNKTC